MGSKRHELIRKVANQLRWSVFIWLFSSLFAYMGVTKVLFDVAANQIPIIAFIAGVTAAIIAANFIIVSIWEKNQSLNLGFIYPNLALVEFFVVGPVSLAMLVFVYEAIPIQKAAVRILWTVTMAFFAKMVALYVFTKIVRQLPLGAQIKELRVPLAAKLITPFIFIVAFTGSTIGTIHYRAEQTMINEMHAIVKSMDNATESAKAQEYAEKSIEETSYMTFGLVMGSLLISYILITVLLNTVLMNLRKTNERAHSLSGGDADLTVKIDVKSNDEVGDIVKNFNTFVNKLHFIIESIKTTSNNLMTRVNGMQDTVQSAAAASKMESRTIEDAVHSIEQLSEAFSKVQSSTSQQKSAFSSANVAVDELLKTIFMISENMDKQTQAISENSSAIEEMISNIMSVAKNVEKATGYSQKLLDEARNGEGIVEEVIEAIHEIEEATVQITDIINVIQEIAEQTNLLAMNAAIEAAHAGEMGKGFAIVADETRKLAENTSDNSKSITQIVKAIKKRVAKTVELASNSGQSLENILDVSSDTANLIDQIHTSNDELNIAGKDVFATMKNLTDITQQVKESVDAQMQSGNIVESQITMVDRLTAELSESMDKSSRTSEEIMEAMAALKEVAKENHQSREHVFKAIEELNASFNQLANLVGTFTTSKEDDDTISPKQLPPA